MRQTSPTLVVRVPWSLRERVWSEAERLGVDPSALMRGVLIAYLEGGTTSFETPGASIIRLVRSTVEIRIPRKQRGRPDD